MQTASKTHPFTGPYDDNWQATDETVRAQLVRASGGVQRNRNINTELRVAAGSTNSGKVSFMTMDSTDGDISTAYPMVWQQCPQS